MEFDNISIGVEQMIREGQQLSLYDYKPELYADTLPMVDEKLLINKKRNKKDKSVNLMGNATIGSRDKSKDEVKHKIKLDEIKTLNSTTHTDKPLKPISISGVDDVGSISTVLTSVSSKTKQNIDKRNQELLKIRRHPYIKKSSVLTEAEKTCYKFLKLRLGNDIVLLSKVRLADVIELNEYVTRDSYAFRRIAYKHLDYLVLSPDLNLICAVELDDYTHNTEKAQERDKFISEVLQDCGIPFFRIGTKVAMLSSEDTNNIEMCVLEYMAPSCPKCGRPMEPKVSHCRYNYGHRFYGCMGWYEKGENHCSYTIDID